MAKLIFLGTASAVAYEGHGNSYLVIQGEKSSILVDCAASPILRLKKAGINFEDLTDLIITHFHADHVSGLPNLLMDMWLLGRQKKFRIHGSQHTISRVVQLMDLFDWKEWQDFYPIKLHSIPMEELTEVLTNSEFRILSSPVDHLIPTLGLRIEYRGGEFITAYSADTNPIPQTVRLAAGADVLIHEATGPHHGHSTPAQAGTIASQAGVSSLYLTHYALYGGKTGESIIAEAKTTFPGNVFLAEDYQEIEFTKS